MNWVKLVAILAAVAAVLGTAYAIEAKWNSAIEMARKEGRDSGRAQALKEVDERDNKQLQAVIAERDRLLKDKEAIEQQRSDDLKRAEDQHVEDVANINRQHDRVLGRLQRERDEARARAAAGDVSPISTSTADTGGSAGADWRVRLPAEDLRALVAVGRDAKGVLARLNECRATLLADRRDR